MNDETMVDRGAQALRRLLLGHNHDVRTLDDDGFARWIHALLARWRGDPVFRQRERIRDLRRANPLLLQLERAERSAMEEERQSRCGRVLRRVEKAVRDAGRAVEGLTGALEEAAPEQHAALQRKLDRFARRRERLRRTHATLVDASPERRRLDGVRDELARLRMETGVEQEEERLRSMVRDRGRRSGSAGSRFEERALQVTRRWIVPELGPAAAGAGNPVHVLHGVTLGAAQMELDQVVVRQVGSEDDPVDVLAVVEVKRNVNDVAHGFRSRMQNLAWLTGDRSGYDPDRQRTRTFPTGHFDREAVHQDMARRFVLGPESFVRLREGRSAPDAPDRLFFITRPGPLWGLPSGALARVAHRVATDPAWDPTSATYLRRLREWCRSLAAPLETPELLDRYAANEQRARRILLVGGIPAPAS